MLPLARLRAVGILVPHCPRARETGGARSTGTLALFPSDGAWARTRVLDTQAIEAGDFDLDVDQLMKTATANTPAPPGR